tara:strand:+ start:1544 stop:3385 length:1842 start_codon:yes stop_codon:yes gene_type:complete
MISAVSYGQTLKTFNGSFPNGKSQPGTASYKYYEDPQTREYIKQGAFKYSIIGKDDLKGLKQTISGNYEKGLKQGTWTYKLIMNDYFLGYYHATGTITLISNYKNGLADGNWTYYTKNKTRKYSNYTGWGEYRPEEVVNASMNFVDGKVVGNVDINAVGVFTAKGSYDEDSYSVGKWKLNLLDKNQTYEIIYKNKFMTDFIGRNGSGQILDGSTSLNPELNAERNQKYLDLREKSTEELEMDGYELDTVCSGNIPTKYIQPYFKMMMSSDWFLYKFIKGDLTYDYNSIHGGCNIVVNKIDFSQIENIQGYEKAEKLFNSGLYMDAITSYRKVKRYIKTYNGYRYKKSDLKRLDKNLQISLDKADSLSKVLISGREVDSLSGNLYVWKKEEINKISEFVEAQKTYFYGYLKEGAINSINDLSIDDALEKNKSTTYFNPDGQAAQRDKVKYYLFCTKDSVINRYTVMLDERLEEISKLRLISQQLESKLSQIDELKSNTRTRLLTVTYIEVLNSLINQHFKNRRYSKYLSAGEYVNFITILNLSLDKIIAFYSAPKDIDKALKKAAIIAGNGKLGAAKLSAETKAKNELLFPFFPFDENGKLEGSNLDEFRNDEG